MVKGMEVREGAERRVKARGTQSLASDPVFLQSVDGISLRLEGHGAIMQ